MPGEKCSSGRRTLATKENQATHSGTSPYREVRGYTPQDPKAGAPSPSGPTRASGGKKLLEGCEGQSVLCSLSNPGMYKGNIRLTKKRKGKEEELAHTGP